jgi:hypothetical protein
MLPARVVRDLPLWVDNRTRPDLDNAVACTEARLSRSFDEVQVRPIIAVMMNIVGDLAE